MGIWLSFVLASTFVLLLPGPTIILVISQSVTYGKRAVVPLVAGVLLGDFTAMTLSFLGLGAVMTTSAAVFTLFKWLGAVYLIYLGVKLLRAGPGGKRDEQGLRSEKAIFRSSFIVTALNPKSIAFFVAFLPQFINPAAPIGHQFAVYGGTFLFLATVNATLYAIFASQLKEYLQRAGVQRWLHRCGGSALIGAGVVTAGMRQAA